MSVADLPAGVRTAMALVFVTWIVLLAGFAWYLRRKHGEKRLANARAAICGCRNKKSRRSA
jgi:hypothetical protein